MVHVVKTGLSAFNRFAVVKPVYFIVDPIPGHIHCVQIKDVFKEGVLASGNSTRVCTVKEIALLVNAS